MTEDGELGEIRKGIPLDTEGFDERKVLEAKAGRFKCRLLANGRET